VLPYKEIFLVVLIWATICGSLRRKFTLFIFYVLGGTPLATFSNGHCPCHLTYPGELITFSGNTPDPNVGFHLRLNRSLIFMGFNESGKLG
jgi:hypothetical protein